MHRRKEASGIGQGWNQRREPVMLLKTACVGAALLCSFAGGALAQAPAGTVTPEERIAMVKNSFATSGTVLRE